MTYLVHSRSPPLKLICHFGPEHTEEDDNSCYRNRAIKRRTQHKRVPLPPVIVFPFYQDSKDKTDDSPATIIRTRSRR